MKRLRHPNLLPLLGSALVSVDTASGARAQVARSRAALFALAARPTIAEHHDWDGSVYPYYLLNMLTVWKLNLSFLSRLHTCCSHCTAAAPWRSWASAWPLSSAHCPPSRFCICSCRCALLLGSASEVNHLARIGCGATTAYLCAIVDILLSTCGLTQ